MEDKGTNTETVYGVKHMLARWICERTGHHGYTYEEECAIVLIENGFTMVHSKKVRINKQLYKKKFNVY